MNSKIWIPVVILTVAVGAFVVGRQYQSAPPAAEEVALGPPPQVAAPPEAVQQPAPAAPHRRRAQPKPHYPEPAAPPTEVSKTGDTVARPVQATPPPAAKPVRVRLWEGTRITFALNDSLSTKTSQTGDPFSGVVSRSVPVGETIAIPEGSVVHGTVSRVQRPGRVKGRAELGLRFDQLELPDGQVYELSASLTKLDESQKETVSEEGQVEGQGSKKRDAATIGGGAGIGALIGAISGGGKGAATGTAIGAGAGTAVVLLTRGKDVEIKRGSELALQLDRPLTIQVK